MQEEDWALSMFMFETKNVIQCECLICQGAAWQACCNLDFVMEEGVDDPMDDPMGEAGLAPEVALNCHPARIWSLCRMK